MDGIRDVPARQFAVRWIDSGREPQAKPDPDYPEGRDVSGVRAGEIGCRLALPYPAKRVGNYSIVCKLCGFALLLSTAGRPDDPRSVTMPCKTVEG
jgi:hypothetical protein